MDTGQAYEKIKLAARQLCDIAMKPSNPEHDQQLDELAASLDAGWDTPVRPKPKASSSQPPLSIPPSSEALDADWDVDSSIARALTTAKPRASRQRPSQQRPSQQRPSQARPGAAPLKVTKQERREAERKRQAHQAQQKSAAKLQRKAERQEEARRASEERRAEQQALASCTRTPSAPKPARAEAIRPPRRPSGSPSRRASRALASHRRKRPSKSPLRSCSTAAQRS